MKRLLGLIAAVGLCIAPCSAVETDESAIKAAYLYNFAKFIQWPDEQRGSLRICTLGEDALGRSLDNLIGKPVRKMQIGIRHAIALHEIPQCDLVYVPAAYAQSLERVRQAVNGYPILTVAESADAHSKGAMVSLIKSDNRIIFEVDLAMTRQLGIQVSAKMLQLARRVYP